MLGFALAKDHRYRKMTTKKLNIERNPTFLVLNPTYEYKVFGWPKIEPNQLNVFLRLNFSTALNLNKLSNFQTAS
jgi:hypothetical protein